MYVKSYNSFYFVWKNCKFEIDYKIGGDSAVGEN